SDSRLDTRDSKRSLLLLPQRLLGILPLSPKRLPLLLCCHPYTERPSASRTILREGPEYAALSQSMLHHRKYCCQTPHGSSASSRLIRRPQIELEGPPIAVGAPPSSTRLSGRNVEQGRKPIHG